MKYFDSDESKGDKTQKSYVYCYIQHTKEPSEFKLIQKSQQSPTIIKLQLSLSHINLKVPVLHFISQSGCMSKHGMYFHIRL